MTGTAVSCREVRLKTEDFWVRATDVREALEVVTALPGPRGTRCGPVAAASDEDRVRLRPCSSFKPSLAAGLPATS